MATLTKQQLLEQGLALLLRLGYHDLGISALLEATGIPKGSFYHHFASKEDFGLQVIDLYMKDVHAGLDRCLGDMTRPPLERVRRFFEMSEQKYRAQGYLGCLLGGLGQELSGVSETFRRKVEDCFGAIAGRIATCLDEAVREGALPKGTDAHRTAELLVNCWEGAAAYASAQESRAASPDAGLLLPLRCRRSGGDGAAWPAGQWAALAHRPFSHFSHPTNRRNDMNAHSLYARLGGSEGIKGVLAEGRYPALLVCKRRCARQQSDWLVRQARAGREAPAEPAIVPNQRRWRGGTRGVAAVGRGSICRNVMRPLPRS